jgi:hypothetical protein
LLITSPIGCNQLQLIVDNLTFDFSFLKEKKLLNKTRRGFEINTNGEGSHSMRVQHGVYGSSRPNLIYGKTTLSFFYFYSLLLVLDLSFCSSFVKFICFWFFKFTCFRMWFLIVVLFLGTIKLIHTQETKLYNVLSTVNAIGSLKQIAILLEV